MPLWPLLTLSLMSLWDTRVYLLRESLIYNRFHRIPRLVDRPACSPVSTLDNGWTLPAIERTPLVSSVLALPQDDSRTPF